MSQHPPNIFVFMSDQERADVVKKGHPCITPVAEKLAEEGLLFDRCYTPTAHSSPARACYFTGMYPSIHGVYNNVCNVNAINDTYDPKLTHFSQRLRAAGYALGITGKWHCSVQEDPADRDWEEVLPTATRTSYMGLRWPQWEAAAKEGISDAPRRRGEIIMPGYMRRSLYGTMDKELEDIHDYQVVMKAIEAMERYARQGKPFCIHCGPVSPHDPYVVPKKYVDMYRLDDVELPPNFHDDLEDKPRVYQRHRRQLWDQLSEEEVRESILHYWAYCTMVDDLRRLVYDAVDDLGLRDNTILIFMSDHGDYLAAHGLYCKGIPSFDEAMRVPCIVRWPEGIENPGRVADEFITLCDFAPTFAEVAGAGPFQCSGRSFAPFFKTNEVEDWPQEYHNQMNGVELYYTQRFVQTKEWKYVFNGFDFDELYDLKNDPYETKNLAQDQAYDEVKLDLVKRMWRFARRENDMAAIRYWTCALAPWGPVVALAD